MDENENETPEPESRDFRRMRERAEAAEARADSLHQSLLSRTIKDAGFDPSLGIVQRLAKDFTGDLDADAFKAFAVAEGLTPVSTEAPAAPQPTETEQQLERLQTAGDQLRNASTSPQPAPDISAQIAKAEAEGDYDTAGLLKAQVLQQRMTAA